MCNKRMVSWGIFYKREWANVPEFRKIVSGIAIKH